VIERGNFVLVDSEVYRVTNDCTAVDTENDYELTNAENENDRFWVSQLEAKRKLENQWQIIEITS